LIALLLPLYGLAGCHLFQSATIDKTCTEIDGCGGPPGLDSDSGGDGGGGDGGDGGDTDTDTGGGHDSDPPPGEPEVGAVFMSETTRGEVGLAVLQPDGSERFDFPVAGDIELVVPGAPVAFHAARDILFLAIAPEAAGDDGQVAEMRLYEEPLMPQRMAPYQGELRSMARVDSAVWVAADRGLIRYEKGAMSVHQEGVMVDPWGIFASEASSGLFVVDRNGGAPVVYDYDPEADRLQSVIPQVDNNHGRVRAPFAGPGGAPWACSSAGGVYDLAVLADGDTNTERLPEPYFEDIVDCGYDPGTDEVIMFSQSEGVWRVAADGSRSQVFHLATGETILRGATW